MILVIHSGAKTIGGSCIEIKTNEARIIFDLGIPLTDEYGDRISAENISKLPDIPNLFHKSKDERKIDAIFISHSHPDHYGLLPKISPDIPVYMSQGCKDIISVSHYFGQTDYNPENAIAIHPWRKVRIKDIEITPYLVDHSAFDAFAYLVKSNGKNVFYSGDFRGHGRKSILFNKILKDPPKNIDALVCEGTTLASKTQQKTVDEKDISIKLVNEFKKNKLIFISVSSQNIDRIISIYKACLKTNKQFVISPYTAYILYRIQRKGLTIPQYNWKNIRVFFVKDTYTEKLADDKILYRFKKAKISYGEISENKNNLVVLDSSHIRKNFKKKGFLAGAVLIYSQWQGYLEKKGKDFWKDSKVEIIYLHSGGHVYPEDLKRFVESISPKWIIPIHSLSPQWFVDTFGNNVVLTENDKEIEI